MGKLNIAHHKSYHPYRRDNIERVRRDEENARREEEEGEQRVLVADAEARIEMLRRRAGVNGSGEEGNGAEDANEVPAAGPSSLIASSSSSSGHINLFEDLEKQNMAIMIKTSSKKSGKDAEMEKGIPLAPSAKDRTPWYSAREGEKGKEVREDVRLRDIARKSRHDPLTQITHELAQRPSSSSSSSHRPSSSSFRRNPPLPSNSKPEVAERLTRESSERQRALELIRRRKMAERGSATPSTVRGGREEGYGDQYNWREVEEAHRGRTGGSAGGRREEKWRR